MASLKEILEASGAEVLDPSGRKVNANDIQQKLDTNNQISSVYSEFKCLDEEEKMEWVYMHKLIGNKYYKCKNYEKAKDAYLETLTGAKILKDEESMIVIMCNMVMCLISLQQYSSALTMANKVLKIKPNHSGALEKRAKVYSAMGRIQEAEDDLNEALRYCEDSSKASQIQEEKARLRQEKTKEKELYKKMLPIKPQPALVLPSWIYKVARFALIPMSVYSSLKNTCKRKNN